MTTQQMWLLLGFAVVVGAAGLLAWFFYRDRESKPIEVTPVETPTHVFDDEQKKWVVKHPSTEDSGVWRSGARNPMLHHTADSLAPDKPKARRKPRKSKPIKRKTSVKRRAKHGGKTSAK